MEVEGYVRFCGSYTGDIYLHLETGYCYNFFKGSRLRCAHNSLDEVAHMPRCKEDPKPKQGCFCGPDGVHTHPPVTRDVLESHATRWSARCISYTHPDRNEKDWIIRLMEIWPFVYKRNPKFLVERKWNHSVLTARDWGRAPPGVGGEGFHSQFGRYGVRACAAFVEVLKNQQGQLRFPIAPAEYREYIVGVCEGIKCISFVSLFVSADEQYTYDELPPADECCLVMVYRETVSEKEGESESVVEEGK